MYPNDPLAPRPPQTSGIDYLNQIAPPSAPQGFDAKTKIILLIFGIIGVLSLVFIFFMANQTSTGPSPATLIARLNNLQTVATKYNKKLHANDIQSANSSLIAILTTANKAIETPAAAAGIDLKKDKKAILALESTTKLEEKLDEAFLNADLDVAYTHSMDVDIADTIVLLDKIARSTKAKSMKEFCAKTSADLANIKKQFSAITSQSSPDQATQ